MKKKLIFAELYLWNCFRTMKIEDNPKLKIIETDDKLVK
jgi:hypothetical protein